MDTERTSLLGKSRATASSQPNLVRQSSGLQWDPIRGRKAATFVLLALTLERLAYYALLANLLVFLILGGNTPKEAMTAVLVVGAIAHFSALGGGWLSDGAIGKIVVVFFSPPLNDFEMKQDFIFKLSYLSRSILDPNFGPITLCGGLCYADSSSRRYSLVKHSCLSSPAVHYFHLHWYCCWNSSSQFSFIWGRAGKFKP